MSREVFVLHPQLAADSHSLGETATAHVLLHRNAVVPWLMLVPKTEHCDFLELPVALRAVLIDDCARLARYLRMRRGAEKINFAAIGNLVPQLHLHVVGRSLGDACWPLPVWGHLNVTAAYSEAEVAIIREEVHAVLAIG
ncbi:MAG: HIT family protein [Gammaproteobacteria bacterium]|nr:HIT family protein [Gammaproteobacteria bacterium]